MTADLTPAPDVAAWLDELERLHAAWQVGGWDGFEAGLKLPHAVPRLTAAVRAAEALARRWRSTTAPLALQLAGDDLHEALTAALAIERTTP